MNFFASRTWRILGTAALVGLLIVSGAAAAFVAVQMRKKPADTTQKPVAESNTDSFTRTGPDTLSASVEAVARVGVETAKAAAPSETVKLPPLQGCLALDNNRLVRVHSRFAGEVASVAEPYSGWLSWKNEATRSLRVGDRVSQGQLLAVVWSKDLGEKKSELVDALLRLRADEENLRRLQELFRESATAERSVREAERSVESDRIAVERAVRTLRSWRLTEAEIDAVRAEAGRVRAQTADRAAADDWAKVEVRATLSGTILEKNVAAGDIVDTTTDLFKIGDLSQLAIWVHVYEEDLPLLRGLARSIDCTVSLPSRPEASRPGRLEHIGEVIDPNQHTALVSGTVDNANGDLKIGQFVTVALQLPADTDEVVVPADAVVEDGRTSIVFVQPDQYEPRYVRRPVQVTKRFHDVIHLRLTPGGVHAGDRVVTAGALILRDALEMLPLPADKPNAD